MSKEDRYYLTNKDILEELKNSKENGRATENLGKMFLTLSEKMTMNKHFVRYGSDIKADLVSCGVLALCKSYNKFDPEKSNNPFGYFSMVTFNAFLQYLNSHYKHKNLKNELTMLDPDQTQRDMVDYYYKYEVENPGIRSIDIEKSHEMTDDEEEVDD